MGLPEVVVRENKKSVCVKILASDYLIFSIASSIVKSMLQSNRVEEIEKRSIVLMDYVEQLSIYSIQVINGIIGSCVSGTTALKVATEEESWPCYYDLEGQTIDFLHDYGVI